MHTSMINRSLGQAEYTSGATEYIVKRTHTNNFLFGGYLRNNHAESTSLQIGVLATSGKHH